MAYIYPVNAFYSFSEKKLFFNFFNKSCWVISQNLDKTEVCRNTEGETELNFDVLEHRIYRPGLHFFLFFLPSPFEEFNDLLIVVIYDSSTRRVEKLYATNSLAKAREFIEEYADGLERVI